MIATIREAAKLADVSERTMQRWVSDGKVLVFVLSPRRRFVHLRSALEYADQRRRLMTYGGATSPRNGDSARHYGG